MFFDQIVPFLQLSEHIKWHFAVCVWHLSDEQIQQNNIENQEQQNEDVDRCFISHILQEKFAKRLEYGSENKIGRAALHVQVASMITKIIVFITLEFESLTVRSSQNKHYGTDAEYHVNHEPHRHIIAEYGEENENKLWQGARVEYAQKSQPREEYTNGIC